MSPIHLTYLVLLLYAFTNEIETQWSESCQLDFRKWGVCLRVELCPAAIELIKRRQYPILCGFDGFEPIVCCEKQADKQTEVIVKSGEYGSVAKQKCAEYVASAVPTTTTTTTTTTIAPTSGPSFGNIAPFVVGGVDAFPLEFPHMAILGYGSEDNIKWQCGGSLISEKFVLTAAHCIYSRLGQVAFVNLGLHEINHITIHAQRFTVKNTYQYPEYKPSEHYHDIALIELNGEAEIQASVKPACLYTDKEIGDDVLMATGWGAVEYGGDFHEVLQKVNLSSVSFNDCAQIYKPQRKLENGLMDELQMCAGSHLSRGDTCQGDSGGPLQFKIEGSKLYNIVGITSFGVRCGILPAVYTRVSRYVSWIEGLVWPISV